MVIYFKINPVKKQLICFCFFKGGGGTYVIINVGFKLLQRSSACTKVMVIWRLSREISGQDITTRHTVSI